MFMNIARLMTKNKQKITFLAYLCNSTTVFLCFCEPFLHDGIQDSEIQILIFQLQEVIVTQGLVVEYVCMSETQ